MRELVIGGLGGSLDESTVVWVIVSSLIGGVIGASVKFTFEDVLRPRLGWRRETRETVRKYTTPLLRSAEALERRINILVRTEDERWFETDEYFRLSTLYVFGEYFGWIRIVERSFGFLPFESSRRGSQFNQRLNGVFRALTGFAYFEDFDLQDADASQVPRLMLTAVGEAMTTSDRERAIEFTDFVHRYGSDRQFRRWFQELEEFLEKAHPEDPFRWDRLILAEAHLRGLIRFLDPRGSMVGRRAVENLELMAHPEMISRLHEYLPDLVPRPADRSQGDEDRNL